MAPQLLQALFQPAVQAQLPDGRPKRRGLLRLAENRLPHPLGRREQPVHGIARHRREGIKANIYKAQAKMPELFCNEWSLKGTNEQMGGEVRGEGRSSLHRACKKCLPLSVLALR